MGSGGKSNRLSKLSTNGFQYLLIHPKDVKAIIKETYGKVSKSAILDSPQIVSYELPIYFMALNAILKIIWGGGGGHMNFKLSDWGP